MQANLDLLPPPGPGKAQLTSQGHPRTVFKRALEHDNLVLAEVTAREIGRVTIAEALELTALVARKQPHRYGRLAARWLCLFLAVCLRRLSQLPIHKPCGCGPTAGIGT